MKELGYEIDKRQVAQMVEFLDEGAKGIITKDAFLKFMTARLVPILTRRTSEMSRISSDRLSTSTTRWARDRSGWVTLSAWLRSWAKRRRSAGG
jgi:hypothetical protein